MQKVKKSDLRVGNLYLARIGDKTVSVRLEAICTAKYAEGFRLTFPAMTHYDVTVVETGEKVRLPLRKLFLDGLTPEEEKELKRLEKSLASKRKKCGGVWPESNH